MKAKFLSATLMTGLLAACGGGSGGSTTSAPTQPTPPPTQTNTAPNAQADNAVTQNGAEVRINVLDNDTDSQNDTLSITSVTQPSAGNVSIDGDTLVFTPLDNSWAGTATFTYEVSDSELTSTGNVSVSVSQVFNFTGVALADDVASAKVQLQIGEEAFQADIDTDNRFSIDYSTDSLNNKSVRFSVIDNNVDLIVGNSTPLVELANQRGSATTYDVAEHPDMLLSPISTALSAIAARYNANSENELEFQIDGDVLLELAAINLLINQGVLSTDTDILSTLSNDETLNALSIELLGEDESIEINSDADAGVEGLLFDSAVLQAAKNEIKALVAPYTRLSSAQTALSKNLSQGKGNLYLDYYQLRPGYQGRVANYDFGGAQLRLQSDGTGIYWAAKGSSQVTWEEQEDGELVVTMENVIIEEKNRDLASLNIDGIISDEVFAIAPQELRFEDAYNTYLTSFSLLRILQGEQVDIIATSLNYDVILDSDSPYRSEAEALNIAEFAVTLDKNLEYHDVASRTVVPFSSEDITGAWGMVIAGTATSQTREDNAEIVDGIFADLVTFTEQGAFSSFYHNKQGSWTLSDDGQLLLSQNDGWELTLTRILQEQDAQGVLVRATNGSDLILTEYRLMSKQTSTSIDMSAVRGEESLWNASWVLNNPNHYNFDGTVKDWAYFGFQFGNTPEDLTYRLSYVYKVSDTIEREVRNRARYVFELDDDSIAIERRFDGTSTAAECEPAEGECYTFWKRVWIPLGQTEDRFYVLEHFYLNFDIITRFYGEQPLDQTLYFLPSGKVNYYEKTPFPDVAIDD